MYAMGKNGMLPSPHPSSSGRSMCIFVSFFIHIILVFVIRYPFRTSHQDVESQVFISISSYRPVYTRSRES